MNIEQELEAIKQRLALLEQERGLSNGQAVIEMDLVLPKADIGGLRFNETKVHAVFEKQEDGCYYSRDILSLSARNTIDDNSRDILSEYLNSYDFRNCIRQQLPEEVFGEVLNPDDIAVSLPAEPQGIKKYNGVACGYWLKQPYSGSTGNFCRVYSSGTASSYGAPGVCGFAPAFRVVKEG